MFIDNVYKKSISYRLYRRFFPKRWQSGLIKSIVYPWVCEDVPYGKISRPWPMPGPQRARPAGPEHAYPSSSAKLWYLAISYLKIAHWSILRRGNEGHGGDLDENGCFTSRKCVLRWRPQGCCGFSGRFDFIYTKNSARSGSGFYLDKK